MNRKISNFTEQYFDKASSYRSAIMGVAMLSIILFHQYGTAKYVLFLLIGTPIAPLSEGLHIEWWSIFSLDLWFVYAILTFFYATKGMRYFVARKPNLYKRLRFLSLKE